MPPSTSVEIALPTATYSKIFFFVNGAAGGTNVTATLHYADATTDVTTVQVPDYYADLPDGDPLRFNLATNLAKWDKTTTVNEADHHNITGVMLTPKSPEKPLNSLTLQRDAMGNLVLWGATAIATSDLATGGASSTGGAAGSAGSASGGSAGAGGSSSGAGAGGGGGPSAGGSASGDASMTRGMPAAGTSGAGAEGGALMAPAPVAKDGGCSVTSRARGTMPWLAVLAAVALRRRRARWS